MIRRRLLSSLAAVQHEAEVARKLLSVEEPITARRISALGCVKVNLFPARFVRSPPRSTLCAFSSRLVCTLTARDARSVVCAVCSGRMFTSQAMGTSKWCWT